MSDPDRKGEIFFSRDIAGNWGDGPAPTEPTNARRGYSLAEAAWRFADDPSEGRRFKELWWRTHMVSESVDRLSIEQLEELSRLQDLLEAQLLVKLRGAKLLADWYPPGTTQAQQMDPSWWVGAHLDLRLDHAEAHGTVATHVYVYKQDAVEHLKATRRLSPRPPVATKKRGPRAVKTPAVIRRMVDDVRSGKLSFVTLGDMTEEALASEYGVSRNTVRTARAYALAELVGVSPERNADK